MLKQVTVNIVVDDHEPEKYRGRKMTQIICPTCGAKCIKYWIDTHDCFDESCKDLSHICYRLLPQKPDLTKLREIYNKLKDDITPYEKDWKNSYLIILWQAIKEVLDAETGNND